MDFSLHLQMLISKLKSHGVTIDKEEAVYKYLHFVYGRWTSAWSRPQQRRTVANCC